MSYDPDLWSSVGVRGETNNARPAVGTPTPTKKDPAEQQVHVNSTYDGETVFVLLPCCAQVIRFILLC